MACQIPTCGFSSCRSPLQANLQVKSTTKFIRMEMDWMQSNGPPNLKEMARTKARSSSKLSDAWIPRPATTIPTPISSPLALQVYKTGDIDPLACDCEGNELNACGGCGDDFSSCEGCTIEFACNYDPLVDLSSVALDDGSWRQAFSVPGAPTQRPATTIPGSRWICKTTQLPRLG